MYLFLLQQTKRKLDDANKRLEFLYDKLREQTVSSVLLPPTPQSHMAKDFIGAVLLLQYVASACFFFGSVLQIHLLEVCMDVLENSYLLCLAPHACADFTVFWGCHEFYSAVLSQRAELLAAGTFLCSGRNLDTQPGVKTEPRGLPCWRLTDFTGRQMCKYF